MKFRRWGLRFVLCWSHVSSANQYSKPCAHSTPVSAGDQRISHGASMPCAQRTQAFAHSIDGDADAIVISGYSHASEQQARKASTVKFGGDVLCDPRPPRSSTVCNIPGATIIPGSSQFDFHIVMHELAFFGLLRNHLQATCFA